jgi:hypothetical protein
MFARLESEAQLGTVYAAIGELDHHLVELPLALDALRDRGYVHSGRLDDQLEALDDRWDENRPRVESALQSHIRNLDREMDETERHLNRLRPNSAAIRAAESALAGLQNQVRAATNAIESLFQGIESDLQQIGQQMAVVTRMMDQIDESTEIKLLSAEGPLLAVESEWQRDGKDGPEGILFLTDQRLLFEERQEIVTKKRLGIFKAETEKSQRLLLEVQISEIESLEDKEEGGFLGMGKADIIEMVLAATASVSRARFHLKGQESADWAKMIRRIQTGDIDDDRADEYVEELELAEATAAAFPEVCPNCFAEVPPQPRGVGSVTCEFCGTVITPPAPESG